MGFLGSVFGGSQPTIPAIPVPPPAAAPATIANSTVAATANNARGRAAGAAALAGNNPTGPQGLEQKPATADVSLLGQ